MPFYLRGNRTQTAPVPVYTYVEIGHKLPPRQFHPHKSHLQDQVLQSAHNHMCSSHSHFLDSGWLALQLEH